MAKFRKTRKLDNALAIIPTAIIVLTVVTDNPLFVTNHEVQKGTNIPQVKKMAKKRNESHV
ncbi:hypothetical protein [Bacillus coahuilensis]|uniref:hypothetical protein n=1 Tax=Bacillus coahuilensis TaxID=408580 RepID=UPI000185094D|nr:hypothetical protein [Bacillus coahuilensis]